MPHGRFHVIVRWTTFTIGGFVGLLAILVLAGPSIRSWQMERAIARFEKRPSQGRADTLVELLQVHAATDEQGKRALALLLHPNIVTRKAYGPGHLVTISLERPFDLDLHKFLWSKDMIFINGLPATPRDSSDTLEHEASCLTVPISYTQPGTYPLELRIQCSMGIERASKGTTLLGYLHDALPWLVPDIAMWRPSRTYDCDFTVSGQTIVIANGEVEKVGLTSSPELDQAMRAAFTARHIYVESEVSTSIGMRRVMGTTQIIYKDIPLAAAFTITVRLPDGRDVLQPGSWPNGFSARAGSSGEFTVYPSNFALDMPGRYKSMVVLVPNPNLAYRDAAIKNIWNGTLEFPISFAIDANRPGR